MPLVRKKDQGLRRHRLLSASYMGRVVAASTAALFVLILLALLAVYRLLADQAEDSQRASIVAMLEQTDSTVAVLFGNLESEARTVLRSDEVADVLVNGWSGETKQAYGIVKQTDRLCQANDLANAIELYFVQDGIVLGSDSTVTGSALLSGQQQALLQGEAGLQSRDGELYWLCLYPEQSPMVRMLIHLDEPLLRRSVLNEDSSIYILDRDMNPLFHTMRYPMDLQVARIEQQTEQVFVCYTDTGEYLTAYRSNETGLVYLSRSRVYSSSGMTNRLMGLLLPVSLLLLAGAAAYTGLLFQCVYRPIQRIIDRILRSQPDAGQKEQNLEQLVQTLCTRMDADRTRSPAVQQALARLGPQLLEQLFRRILFEGVRDPAVIEAEIKSTGESFPQDRPYVVVCLCPWLQNTEQGEKNIGALLNLYMQGLSKSYWEPLLPCVMIPAENGQLVLVISCRDTTREKLETLMHGFGKKLAEGDGTLSFRIAGGRSEPGMGLEQMADLYQDARQALSRALYDLNSGRKKAAETAQAAALPWQPQLRTMLEAALKGRQTEAETACTRLLELLDAQGFPGRSAAEICDTVSRRLRQLPDTPEPAPPGSSRQELVQYLHSAIGLLVQSSRESQMDYLESARARIAQCYGDASLSLDEVARWAGISGPYLSSLFTNLQGEHFVNYLNRYRVEQACEMLRTTSLSIADIGFRCGFNSSSSFIRVFKKYCSVSPGAYRTGNA